MKSKKELKTEINSRLWYAVGDILPTEERMTRTVESILSLIFLREQEILEMIRDKKIKGVAPHIILSDIQSLLQAKLKE